MKAHTEKGLLQEFTELQERVPEILGKVKGRLFFETRKHANEQARDHSPLQWVHLAHRGTLEKIPGMLTGPGPYGTMELLATARNLFENLVWIRSMASDVNFGLVFYAHLLNGQIQHAKSYIEKLTSDAALFDTAGEIDLAGADEAIAAFTAKAEQEAVDKHTMRDLLHSRMGMLDDMMREEFALYSDNALTRGYGMQAFVMREQIIPRFRAELDTFQAYKAALDAALPGLLSPQLQNLVTAKWNWADRAKAVAMENYYRFIYSFTSRLLHSTPVNIITDKALDDQERVLVLNYIVVACKDIFKKIEDFSHPDMVNAVFIHME